MIADFRFAVGCGQRSDQGWTRVIWGTCQWMFMEKLCQRRIYQKMLARVPDHCRSMPQRILQANAMVVSVKHTYNPGSTGTSGLPASRGRAQGVLELGLGWFGVLGVVMYQVDVQALIWRVIHPKVSDVVCKNITGDKWLLELFFVLYIPHANAVD